MEDQQKQSEAAENEAAFQESENISKAEAADAAPVEKAAASFQKAMDEEKRADEKPEDAPEEYDICIVQREGDSLKVIQVERTTKLTKEQAEKHINTFKIQFHGRRAYPTGEHKAGDIVK